MATIENEFPGRARKNGKVRIVPCSPIFGNCQTVKTVNFSKTAEIEESKLSKPFKRMKHVKHPIRLKMNTKLVKVLTNYGGGAGQLCPKDSIRMYTRICTIALQNCVLVAS